MCRTANWLLGLGIAASISALAMGAAKAGEKQTLAIKGSDTMVHLASYWAEEYLKKNPNVEISVTGGGSGTGIAALLNGTTDIANASRPIEEKEKKLAAEKKLDIKEHLVGLDGICVVVNPACPLQEISLEQLEGIFTGKTTNWKEVGGNDAEIVTLSRESSSGTYVFFQEHVMKKKNYGPKVRPLPATAAIIQEVSSNEKAIGYVGLGYAEEAKGKVKILAVKNKEGDAAVMPSIETVVNNTYPIARGLFCYTNGEPQGVIKDYLDFCKGPDGQKIVEKTGFVPVPEKK